MASTHEVDGRGVIRFLQVTEEEAISADRGESPPWLGALVFGLLVALFTWAFDRIFQ